MTLAYLAGVLLEQGSIGTARKALAKGERLLRQASAYPELGRLLCIRAEVEQGSGEPPVAHASLREAEELAARIESGPDSELGRMIAKVRRTLGKECGE